MVGKRGEWVGGRKEESGRVKLVSFPWSFSYHEKEPGYKTRKKGGRASQTEAEKC